jgi:D-alanyl-D-alanine carboxypeptidase (penicillin-binding protein 5/6)
MHPRLPFIIPLLLIGISINAPAFAKEPPDTLTGPPFVSARAWAVVDGKTGELLWGHDADKPAKAASTTKMMCAWTVLQLAKKDPKVLDETVTFSKLADDTGGSTSGIREGERISVRECLYGLLLPSGNDAGNALAEHFNDRLPPPEVDEGEEKPAATTRSNFIAEMNRHAKALGMTNTTYRIPYGDGGSAQDMTTTPHDLLRLARQAMQDERFRHYVSTQKYATKVDTPDGGKRDVSWTNTNHLLDIEGFDGVKTGTTTQAGACLVSSGRRGDDHLLIAVLGATSAAGRYVDSKNLYRWAWLQRGHGR